VYGIAPKLPVAVSPSEGFICTKNVKENTQQNLKNLLLTSPGERVMDVEFGVGIRNFLFENFNEIDLESRIEEQVRRYMPFLQVTSIRTLPDPDHGTLSLELVYSVSNIISEETMSLSIDPKLNS